MEKEIAQEFTYDGTLQSWADLLTWINNLSRDFPQVFIYVERTELNVGSKLVVYTDGTAEFFK